MIEGYYVYEIDMYENGIMKQLKGGKGLRK
jgi:hypothetical protein